MPKAAVNKNRNAPANKNKIGLSKQRIFPSPADDSAFAENADEFNFRRLVAAAPYARHYPRSLFLGECVSHRLASNASFGNRKRNHNAPLYYYFTHILENNLSDLILQNKAIRPKSESSET